MVDPRYISRTNIPTAVHHNYLTKVLPRPVVGCVISKIQYAEGGTYDDIKRLRQIPPVSSTASTYSLSLCLPSQLPVHAFSDTLVELMGIYDRSLLPAQNADEIFQERVRPVRCGSRRSANKARATTEANLIQGSADECGGHRDHNAGLPDLRHLRYLRGRVRALTTGGRRSTHNEVGVDALHDYPVLLNFIGKCGRERFGECLCT